MQYSLAPEQRAIDYATTRGLVLTNQLGSGKDGSVYFAKAGSTTTAVKALEARERYAQELACYRRLQAQGVTRVCGHNVPVLLAHDDTLGIIEMTVVSRPYVLDFATVTLDQPPDFPNEILAERHRHWSWVFGPERWARVQIIIAHFQRLGIYLLDPNPRNIAFSLEEEEAWAQADDARQDESDSSDAELVDPSSS